VLILGAGPAGLTAAYELGRQGWRAEVFEAAPVVGGLARTVEYRGYLFDLGGHRFYTKIAKIEAIWREVLGDDLLERPRLSRIYYNHRFFRYPLEPFDALRGLGVWEAARCAWSYLKAAARPQHPEDDFETYICNRFGRRLFERFFRSYTEKVWGLSCKEIRAEWAAQRIRGLSFAALLRNSFEFGVRQGRKTGIRTLTTRFLYPRRGPGMMWERMRAIVERQGSQVHLNAPVARIFWEPGRVTGIEVAGRRLSAGQLISSLPVSAFCLGLDPPAPEHVLRAARSLRYRDFLIAALIVRRKEVFPDNWIYIHEPGVRVGRIQNFKNWSPEMVPDPDRTCLGMEYFCTQGDDLWSMPDAALVRFAAGECERLGIVPASLVEDGAVVRVPKAYPVYDSNYAAALKEIRDFTATLKNLQFIGRNGMHRYNNQDHSMLSGILAAGNVMGASHDLWSVNTDGEYLEELSEQPESTSAACV
jgi:protoporphyrinogen oxidase